MLQYSSRSTIIRLHNSPAAQRVLGTRNNAFHRRDKYDFREVRYSIWWRRRVPRKLNVSEHMLRNTPHSFLTRTRTRDNLCAYFLVPCTASNCRMTGNDGMVGPKKITKTLSSENRSPVSVSIRNLPQKRGAVLIDGDVRLIPFRYGNCRRTDRLTSNFKYSRIG